KNAGRKNPAFFYAWPRAGLVIPGTLTSTCQCSKAFFCTENQLVSRSYSEQPIGNNAGDLIQLGFCCAWINDVQIVNIEDNVAVVGDESFPVNRITTQFDDLACYMASGHGDDFDRKREISEHIHQFASICNTHKFACYCCDDFFARQCSTATFDQLQKTIGFIGTIYINSNFWRGIQIDNRNLQCFQAACSFFGTGNGGSNVLTEFTE